MKFRDICKIFGSQSHVAKVLGVSDRTVRRWVKADKIPCWVMDRLIKYNKEVEKELWAYVC